MEMESCYIPLRRSQQVSCRAMSDLMYPVCKPWKYACMAVLSTFGGKYRYSKFGGSKEHPK